MDKMRQTFAACFDAKAMKLFEDHVNKLAADSTNGRSLLALAAIHDYNPMISRTFGMRYACRQAGCGFIPRGEMGWIIAQQRGAPRE